MGIYKKKWEWGVEEGQRHKRGEKVWEEGAEVEREKDGRVRGEKSRLWKNGALNEGVDAGDGVDGVSNHPSLPTLQEEIVTVRRHWHDVDNSCSPAAPASSALLYSTYDVHVVNVLIFIQL